MKQFLISVCLVFLAISGLSAQDMIVLKTELSVEEAVSKMQQTIEKKGLTVFSVIDHQANAAKADMEIQPLTVLIFGNPKMGSRLMKADPRIGIHLPMKILVFAQKGQTRIGYYDPMLYMKQFELSGQKATLLKMQEAMAAFARSGIK